MKIEKRTVKDGVVQITTTDERWYEVKDRFIPSVTWICDSYPKGIAFYKWLADKKNWDEAEAQRDSAGAQGSKVHKAIEDLLNKKEVKMNDKYLNTKTEEMEELTVSEWEAIMSFENWYKETKPEVIDKEFTVIGDNYAGTVDLLCVIDNKVWIIDFKTSQYIWPAHELQVSAYRNAFQGKPVEHIGILQLGYRRNKRLWKLTEVDDKYDLFQHAYAIWQNEHGGEKPRQKDYPLKIQL